MKTYRKSIRDRDFKQQGLMLVYLVVTLSPVIFLALAAAADFRSGKLTDLPGLIFSARRLKLLLTTMTLAAVVAAAGMAVSMLTAFWLWQHPRGSGRALRWLILLFILVPPFVHAQSWIFATDNLNLLLLAAGWPTLAFDGFGAAAWVQLMSFLPIATGLALAGFMTVDRHSVEAALLDAPAGKVLPFIILPQAAAHVLAGGSLLFILSLSDYGIPAVFRLNVYSLDIFAEYSASNVPGRPFLLALPYLAAIFIILLGSQSWLARMDWQGSYLNQDIPKIRVTALPAVICLASGLTASVAQIFVPLVNLLLQTGSPAAFLTAVRDSLAEIRNTAAVSLLAAAIALPVALAAAASLGRHSRITRFKWLAIALPAALPASLTGIGAVVAWNQPFLNTLYGTLCAPALVAVSRFAPFAAVILYAGLQSIDPDLRDILKISGRPTAIALGRAFLPLILPSLLASASLVFALTAGELGATLIICPPGKATLTLKIYNYLHYGATETVASLCLFMTLLALVCGLLAGWLLTAGKEALHAFAFSSSDKQR